MILGSQQHIDTSLYEFLLIDTNTAITIMMALVRNYHYDARVVRLQQYASILYLIRVLFHASLAYAI